MSPQHVQQGFQKISPQWTKPDTQKPITHQPQSQMIQAQQNNVIHQIYPVQKVMLQVQP